MKLEIVAIGKLRDKRYRALMREYMGRLSHYGPCEETSLRGSKLAGQDVPAALAEEAEAFERRCGPRTLRVAMDERGEALTSVELARRVEQWMTYGQHHVAFFIGSANGLDPDFRARCDSALSLSAMTLPHEMARVLLAEQLYRAMTIIRNEPYHK